MVRCGGLIAPLRHVALSIFRNAFRSIEPEDEARDFAWIDAALSHTAVSNVRGRVCSPITDASLASAIACVPSCTVSDPCIASDAPSVVAGSLVPHAMHMPPREASRDDAHRNFGATLRPRAAAALPLLRFAGVLAPRHTWRAGIVPQPPLATPLATPSCAPAPSESQPRHPREPEPTGDAR
jgi:hypothetical protein